ncbi:MAG: hypothetical protein E7652_00255 [Ruminococcaceae bacterium]|nr:hypothetical protein [Oscillospiraceae bacterium]
MPKKKIADYATLRMVKIGFVFKDNGDIKEFNGNVYANVVDNDYDLMYSKDQCWYYYNDGVYTQTSDMELKNTLVNDFNERAQNTWKPSYEHLYWESLKHKVFYAGELNENKKFINFRNGMLDLETRDLIEHAREYYSTVQLPFEYDPDAQCPIWESFLESSFEGDKERINLSQECLGYLLSSETRAQKALVLYGSGGNGKGVFSSIIEALVGRSNISYAGLADLSNQFVRATLVDKQLIMSSENEISHLNTQYFKQIVGGDTCIMASHKNKKPFEFFPKCKIVMSTNNLPDTKDRSEGYYRRLQFLHFSKFFNDDERDVHLTEKLKEELPGIFNWALIGLDRLKSNDFKFSPCKSSDILLQEYRVEQNPFLEFINECLILDDPREKEENRVVYNSFKLWCSENGHRGFSNMSSKKFWRELDNAMILLGYPPTVRKNSGNHRFCHGVSIKRDYRYTEF